MAEERRNLSLVPYSNQVVLRHGSTVMVYDENSKQMSLSSSSECPYCKRPFRRDSLHEEPVDEAKSPGPGDEYNFVRENYFRLLQHSHPPSERSSRPASPGRDLVETTTSEPGTPGKQRHSPDTSYSQEPASTTSHRISSNAFSPGYFHRFFQEEGELGRGGNGVVLLVSHKIDQVSLGQYACKRVPVGDNRGWLERVLTEVTLLQKLNHPNLVAYKHVWLEEFQITKFGPHVPCAFILQQYCNGGDLQNYILGERSSTVSAEQLKEWVRTRSRGQMEPPQLSSHRRLPFDEIVSFFKDISEGLNHLHSNGYVHRDLKPSNCLIHTSGRKTRVLVSDFGEMQGEGVLRRSTGNTGTISYCAPEVLRQEAEGGAFGNFTPKSDIFSLGMIVYFMCFGKLPYINADDINEENEDLDLLRAEITSWVGIEDERNRSDLPEKLYKFLKRLLSTNPEERPSTDEILKSMQAVGGGGDYHDVPSPTATGKSFDFSRAAKHNTTASSTANGIDGAGIPSPTSTLSRSRARSPGTESIPLQRSATEGSSGSPGSSVILRKGSSGLDQLRHPPQRPRLMPPPNGRRTIGPLYFLENPQVIVAGKMLVFGLKFWSLFSPCLPFTADPMIVYPLLLVAALDLVGVPSGLGGSVVVAVFHALVVASTLQYGTLCAKGPNALRHHQWKIL